MRKIFFTAVPVDSNFHITSMPFNPKGTELKFPNEKIYFPISAVIYSKCREDDEVTLFCIQQVNELDEGYNMQVLKDEIQSLNLPVAVDIRQVPIKENQDRSLLMSVFEELIATMEPNAYYYADITFGTKSYPLILLTALNYADDILEETHIAGIYYQEVKRKAGHAAETHLYDVTVLHAMSSLIDTVKDLPAAARVSTIKAILHPEELK